MKTKFKKSTPKISAVCAEYVSCGKPNCRCSVSPDYYHGPYFYVRSQANGRRSKRYVRAAEVDVVKKARAERKEQERQERKSANNAKANWRTVRDSIRQIEGSLKP